MAKKEKEPTPQKAEVAKKEKEPKPQKEKEVAKAPQKEVKKEVPHAPQKEAPVSGESKGKKQGKKKGHEVLEAKAFMQKFRPRRRWICLAAFAAVCAWFCWSYDQCNVKGKRQDCGYSAISANMCKSVACFTKGGGKMAKTTFTVERKKDQTFGLELAEDGSNQVVVSIGDGAVKEHNTALPDSSPNRIAVGDLISKLDGYTGKGMLKANGATTEKSLPVEVQRSKLPSFLRFLHSKDSTPGKLEMVLTAPGFIKFATVFYKVGGLGTFVWYISGYPLASLPMYYMLSAGVSWNTARCCYETVQSGPHCYKGNRDNLEDAVLKGWDYTQKTLQPLKEDPLAVLKGWFEPPKIWDLLKK